MKGELFFEIPSDQEAMVKLVEAVPADWSWIDGQLRPSPVLLATEQVEENTGFAVERYHSIHPTIIGTFDVERSRRREPNLFAIMVEQKLPGFIWFAEAGYNTNITFETAKRIAVGFVRRGYRGRLDFFSGCHDNSKYDNTARCSIALEPWEGPGVMYPEDGPQSARVKLEWYGSRGGSEKSVASILAVCRSLNFREYVPRESRGTIAS